MSEEKQVKKQLLKNMILNLVTFSIIFTILFFLNLISIFIFWDTYYITKIFAICLAGGIELGIMSYFIFVIYCFLVISKDYDSDLNRVGAEYQELLKDFKDNKEFKELKD